MGGLAFDVKARLFKLVMYTKFDAYTSEISVFTFCAIDGNWTYYCPTVWYMTVGMQIITSFELRRS